MKEERWSLTVKTSDWESSIWVLAKIMQKKMIKASIIYTPEAPRKESNQDIA